MKRVARLLRYVIAGGVAAMVDICLFLFLIRVQLSVQVAGTISFIVATFVNFVLSSRFVFADRQTSGFGKVAATYAVSTVGLLLNQTILWLGINEFLCTPLVAKLMATGIVFFWNYFIRNYYVFKS